MRGVRTWRVNYKLAGIHSLETVFRNLDITQLPVVDPGEPTPPPLPPLFLDHSEKSCFGDCPPSPYLRV